MEQPFLTPSLSRSARFWSRMLHLVADKRWTGFLAWGFHFAALPPIGERFDKRVERLQRLTNPANAVSFAKTDRLNLAFPNQFVERTTT